VDRALLFRYNENEHAGKRPMGQRRVPIGEVRATGRLSRLGGLRPRWGSVPVFGPLTPVEAPEATTGMRK